MGPPSSEESQQYDDAGLEGLDSTDDELKESTTHAKAPKEEDDEIDPGEGEEGPGQRGQMSCFLLSFGPPSKLPPRRDGPEGNNWCRVDFIVDSGASDNTLPVGVLPGISNEATTRLQGLCTCRWSYHPKLGTEGCSDGISMWAGADWNIFSGG